MNVFPPLKKSSQAGSAVLFHSWETDSSSASIARVLFSNAISIMMPETAEEISEKPEVRKELQRATGEKARQRVKARGRDKFWFVAYALILAGCVVLFFLFGAKVVPLPQPRVDILRRILRGATLIVIVLAIAKAISVYALGRIEDPST